MRGTVTSYHDAAGEFILEVAGLEGNLLFFFW